MELRIRDVSKTYPNGVQALKDVTLTIPARDVRPARPQRRRQVHADAHPRHAAGAGRRQHPPRRHRRAAPEGRSAQDARLPAAGVRRLSEGERGGAARSLRAAQGHRRAPGAQGSRRGAPPADEPVGGPQAEARRLLGRHAAALRRRRGAARQSEADDRGRADGRPRPGRARALPQPAARAGREQRRPPLHAHRRGRERAVHADGDHRPGRDPARGRAAARGRATSAAGSGAA